MTDLFAYQQVGSAWLAKQKYALLADEMGLGKSAQAITAADNIFAHTVLVVCPASMRETWRREFDKFSALPRPCKVLLSSAAPEEGAVNIVSYDGMVRMKEKLMQLKYGVIIFDEAHFLKSLTAKRTQAAYGFKKSAGLVSRADRVWLLTGTPAPNNPFELYPMCKALFYTGFGGMNRYEFINKFCETKNNGFGLKIVGGKNLGVLKARLAPHTLRRKKVDVLQDLPPIRFENLYLDAHKELEKLQTAEELDLLISIAERLSKARSDEHRAALLEAVDTSVAQRLRRILGQAKVPGMVAWLKDQIEGGLEKIVVFGHHKSVLQGIADGLKDVSPFVRIDGSTSPDDRDKAVQSFQNDPKVKVFIGQLQAAGTGLTLTAASDLVFAEYSWVPAENDQAAMRVHRIGQKNSVLIRYAVVSGSLDERIAAVVRAKAAVIKQVFN